MNWVDIVCELCWTINAATLIPYLTGFASIVRYTDGGHRGAMGSIIARLSGVKRCNSSCEI